MFNTTITIQAPDIQAEHYALDVLASMPEFYSGPHNSAVEFTIDRTETIGINTHGL